MSSTFLPEGETIKEWSSFSAHTSLAFLKLHTHFLASSWPFSKPEQRHCCCFPSFCNLYFIILVRIGSGVAGPLITSIFRKMKWSTSHGFVKCLLSIWQESQHYILSTVGIPITFPPICEMMWHHLLLLLILTQMLPSKTPLIPATQTFRVLVSLSSSSNNSYNPNYTSALLPETKSFHIHYSFASKGKEEIGSYYFPLYTQGSYWSLEKHLIKTQTGLNRFVRI